MTKIQGGYVLISVGQFANLCAARDEKRISFLAFRVWLAAHEQKARRCMAKHRRFTTGELAELVREKPKAVERALRQLAAEKLICWSESAIEFPRDLTPSGEEIASDFGTSPKRPVPVPRRLLRAMFRHTRPAEVLAAIGHVIRCLFIRAGKIRNDGLVKASWIASTFRIAERSVQSARKWLTTSGFLVIERVHQLVMNRWGGKFSIVIQPVTAPSQKAVTGSRFAPPSKTKSTSKSTSNNQINNKPARTASGVLKEPTLNSIQPEDLRKPLRLEVLYRQAVQAGWIEHSEASVRNFCSAAVRATRTGGRVGAIFAGIVKKRLWHHITQEQEDRAVIVIKRFREKQSSAFKLQASAPAPGAPAPILRAALSVVLGALTASKRQTCDEAERRKQLLRQADQAQAAEKAATRAFRLKPLNL
jgi:hypothetical protein